MSDVQFNEAPSMTRTRPVRGIAGFLIKSGFVKDEVGANTVMLALAVLALALTAFLWVSGFAGGTSSGVTPEERARLEAL